ncbi:MAG: SUF system Fe-S cluster assembly protein [Chitinophagales bacterium]|nr:SUF system Fe-S cluster assembly protein [Chitinophagales bacterium]
MEKSFVEIKDEIITALQTIYDPEIPVNIYELGLIYEVNVDPANNVHVLMTLTSPSCPAAGSLPGEVEVKAKSVEGVKNVEVEITFDPPWSDELMSEAAKLELGFL